MVNIPVELTLREIPNSAAIEKRIYDKVAKLSLYCQQIEFCKVVVEYVQKHKHQGRLLAVNIEVGVPQKRLVVNHKTDEDLYVVIRDAFHAMRRQLEHYADKRHQAVKQHAETLQGRVVRLFDDYGFIEDQAGREFYFSYSNVLHHEAELLNINTPVNFLESEDDVAADSLQASHISLAKAA